MIDILIPTINRKTALSITLTSLCFQTLRRFRIIISDQSKDEYTLDNPEIKAVIRVLKFKGHYVKMYRNLPLKGIAQQRQFLLNKSKTKFVTFIDDDLILEPFVVEGMLKAIKKYKCGFVGRAVIGLSYIKDKRPDEQKIEFWENNIFPEKVIPGDREWFRHKLHNAANLLHIEQKLRITFDNQKAYKVAWVGGCVMYDSEKLKAIGGFNFWNKLPKEHCGEDAMSQLLLMEKYGGCGLIPSGVYHQELTTTVLNRKINIPNYLIKKLF